MSASDHLSQHQFPEDPGTYFRVPYDKIRAHAKGVNFAHQNITAGNPSRSPGPLEVQPTGEGDYQLVDGYHRYTYGLLAGQRDSLAVVSAHVGAPVADAEDRFEYKQHQQFGGLEQHHDHAMLADDKRMVVGRLPTRFR